MEKQFLIYQPGSNTIRQMPQNYLIAHKEHGAWICEPDLAADIDLAVATFLSLMEWNNKYAKSGNDLLEAINVRLQKH